MFKFCPVNVRSFLLILLSAGVMSCSDRSTDRMLKDLDRFVAGRLDVYAAYEASLQPMKDSLAAALTDEQRWMWADSLYESYSNYSLDSTMAYVGIQSEYASTPRQSLISTFHEILCLVYMHNEAEAEELFLSLDTLQVKESGLMKDYYHSGMILYSNMKRYSRHIPASVAAERHMTFRSQLLSVDSLSFFARKTYAQALRDRGEYSKALDILDSLSMVENDTHNQALIAFNQAEIYSRTGERDKMAEALARSVRHDINSSVRNYLSLYNLALMEYQDQSFKRANYYISANMTDAIAGGFNTRMMNAATSQMIIADATRAEERQRNIWLFVTLCCFFVLTMLAMTLFIINNRHARRLNSVKNRLLEMNNTLKSVNDDLKLANRIKDSYVFGCMELAVRYLEKLDAFRKESLAIAKNDGLGPVMRFLRSPSAIYEEYRHYYKVFDETFLGIFPDFREKVNALLKEDSRFTIPDEPVLCMELRILAAIRLGITESGKIAVFLNCAPTTVYTYRTRLKRAALCSKDEFESKIASI